MWIFWYVLHSQTIKIIFPNTKFFKVLYHIYFCMVQSKFSWCNSNLFSRNRLSHLQQTAAFIYLFKRNSAWSYIISYITEKFFCIWRSLVQKELTLVWKWCKYSVFFQWVFHEIIKEIVVTAAYTRTRQANMCKQTQSIL